MKFSLLHKCVTYLLSGLGLVALSLGNELSEGTLVLIFIGYVASWFAEERVLIRPRYAAGWTAAVVAFLLLQVARGMSDRPTLAMAIEFAAFLQISRLFNRRTAVDYQQIAVLAFLHLIAATVLSTTLSYAAIFAGFVIATPWMLALSHLRREIEGNYPPSTDADPSARSAIARVLRSRRVVGPQFLLGTALLSLPLFAMTLAIFIAVPRVGQGFLSFNHDSGQRVAGFGNQVELGGFGVIRDDPTVVVRVMPLPSIDQKAPRVSLRLRGTSFDHYDGRRWTRTPNEPQRMPRLPPFVYPIHRLPDPDGDKQVQILLEHLEEPVVFLPEGTVALSVPARVSNGESFERELTHGVGLDVRYENPDGLGLVYTAFITGNPHELVLPAIDEERAADYLKVPPGHERVAELARRVVGDASTDEQKARRIERFLKQGDYSYTLEQPNTGTRAPLDVFLFDVKRGHCEYFSSAMAIMLRTVGVPTRDVTGFVGGQYNPYGRYYALRQGDAHSWVEAYVRERGWVTFDPTPTSRADEGPRQGLWSDLNAFIDAMRTRWMTSVVGYDLRSQVGLLHKAARWFAELRGSEKRTAVEDQAHDGVYRNVPWRRAGRLLGALVALGLLAFAASRLLRPGATASARARSRQQAQIVRLYGEFERALAQRGHPRPAALTPLEHAHKLSESGFPQRAEVETITGAYLEARYGGRPLRAAEVAELRSAIERIRKAA
jgi:hypothetical protein